MHRAVAWLRSPRMAMCRSGIWELGSNGLPNMLCNIEFCPKSLSLRTRRPRLLSMNADGCSRPPLEPPSDWVDPRRQSDFIPAHWPLCDGEPAPGPEATGLHERSCIELLAAFYRINLVNSRWVAAGQAGAAEFIIKTLLFEAQAAMAALEKIEDRYAPIGF